MKKNSITITYLSKVSFASLNGADKDVDNINPIKKITVENGTELPYVSSQALRRAFAIDFLKWANLFLWLRLVKEKTLPAQMEIQRIL